MGLPLTHRVIAALAQPLAVLDGTARIISANDAFLGILPGATAQRSLLLLARAGIGGPAFADYLERALTGALPGVVVITVHVPGRADRIVTVTWRRAPGAGASLLLTLEDITPDVAPDATVCESSADGGVLGRQEAATLIARLTPRERQVMDLVVLGRTNKNIAHSLRISQRTVESHRAAAMKQTGVRSLPDLVRLVILAGRRARDFA